MGKIFLIFLLAFPICFTQGKRDYKIFLEKCKYNIFHKEVLSYVNCTVVRDPVKPEKSLLYGGIRTTRNVSLFEFRASFDILRKDNTKINLMNQKVDGCKFLEGGYEHNLLRANLQELRRVGDFPKKCPIVGGELYKIEGFTVDPEIYPPFLPAMSFQLLIEFYENGRDEGNFVLNGRVTKN